MLDWGLAGTQKAQGPTLARRDLATARICARGAQRASDSPRYVLLARALRGFSRRDRSGRRAPNAECVPGILLTRNLKLIEFELKSCLSVGNRLLETTAWAHRAGQRRQPDRTSCRMADDNKDSLEGMLAYLSQYADSLEAESGAPDPAIRAKIALLKQVKRTHQNTLSASQIRAQQSPSRANTLPASLSLSVALYRCGQT